MGAHAERLRKNQKVIQNQEARERTKENARQAKKIVEQAKAQK